MNLAEYISQPLDGWEILDQTEETFINKPFEGPYTDDGIKTYICELFYPNDNEINGIGTKRARLLKASAQEIEHNTTPEQFEAILQLAGLSVELSAAFKFESLDRYLQHGDIDTYHRNIFDPRRTIALSSYVAGLIYFDYQIRGALINEHEGLLDAQKTIDRIKTGHAMANSYTRNSKNILIWTDRHDAKLPLIKTNWNQVEPLNNSITPDQWRTFTQADYLANAELLREMYPNINIDAVIESMPRLRNPSSYYAI